MAVKSYTKELEKEFDIIVAGGGLAGICAAISAARQNKKVVLVQDRPVLGGNSSSEIRVPPGGAGGRGGWARETGIIEEIMVNDRARNHDPYLEGTMNSMWDLNLYEAVRAEKNITLFLNSIVTAVEMKDKGTIKSVLGIQSMSEQRFKFYGKYFIDCTGDGVVGAFAGAEFRYGREARSEFGESLAPLKADNKTQGNTLMYRAYDVGYPVKFTPPSWYEDYKKEGSLYKRDVEIFPRKINNRTEYCGHWWIEVGVPFLTIEDNDKIGKEIIRHQMGVWDYIKNSGKYDADNFVLEWLGMLPGKRESRRFVGDYILKQQDIVEQKKFSDRIAFGGWFLDVHTMGGILAKDEPPEGLAGDEDLAPKLKTSLYSIPFKSIYSKNIENLLMAGRNISVTHAALGSTRVMLTCALLGQAAGTAASMCLTKKTSPRILGEKHIYQLQQQLIKDDCFIYDMPNSDEKDLARTASVKATSELPLMLEPIDEVLPPNIFWSQSVPISEKRIEKISLHVKSKNKKDVEIAIEILPIEDIWAFNKSIDVPPLISVAKVVGGYEGWVDFYVGSDVTPGLYRINIPNASGISFSASSHLPGVAVTYREPHWDRYVSAKNTIAMRISPASHPFGAKNIINGVARPEKWPNIWISDPAQPLPQSITIDFGKKVKFNTVYLTFDTMLINDFRHYKGACLIEECVSDYTAEVKQNGKSKEIFAVEGNYQRRRIHRFQSLSAETLKINITKTNGDKSARIYEVRVYDE